MLTTKPNTKRSRMKEMRDDLSIIVGIQERRRSAKLRKFEDEKNSVGKVGLVSQAPLRVRNRLILNQHNTGNGNSNNEYITQGPWVSRSSKPIETLKYSVKELIDIILGDSPGNLNTNSECSENGDELTTRRKICTQFSPMINIDDGSVNGTGSCISSSYSQQRHPLTQLNYNEASNPFTSPLMENDRFKIPMLPPKKPMKTFVSVNQNFVRQPTASSQTSVVFPSSVIPIWEQESSENSKRNYVYTENTHPIFNTSISPILLENPDGWNSDSSMIDSCGTETEDRYSPSKYQLEILSNGKSGSELSFYRRKQNISPLVSSALPMTSTPIEVCAHSTFDSPDSEQTSEYFNSDPSTSSTNQGMDLRTRGMGTTQRYNDENSVNDIDPFCIGQSRWDKYAA